MSRILVVTDGYYPSRLACAVRMKVLVETLKECGHDVHVLACDSSTYNITNEYQQPSYVHFFPVVDIGNKSLVNRLRNNLSGSIGAIRAAKELGDFDIVLITSPPVLMMLAGMRIARIKKAKLVLDVRDIWPDVGIEMGSFSESSPYARVFGHIARRAYREAGLVCTVSEGKQRKLQARMPAGEEGKVRLVTNGLDLDFVRQDEDQELVSSLGLDKDPCCVYVGNIGLAQGLDTLLELAALRPDVRVLLFGDGASKQGLIRQANELGLTNVNFYGVLGARGVYTVLRNASLAYVPLVSSRLYDSIPTKMFEAMGCGCPVLLAAQGESVSVLEDVGLGISAPPEDIVALANAFNELIDRPFSEKERSAAANYVRENYSRQDEAKKLNDYLEEL